MTLFLFGALLFYKNTSYFVRFNLKSLIIYVVFQVKMTFLMVGHTHEDVDQMFSCINKLAHQRNILTVEDLHKVCEEGYHPTPTTQHLSSLWDFKKMASFPGVLQGIKEPHVFKFQKRGDDVIMAYKDWPVHAEPYREINLSQVLPEWRTPDVVQSNTEKARTAVAEMRKDLPRWVDTGKFSDVAAAWWRQYLEKLEEGPQDLPTAPTTLPVYREAPPEPVMDANLASAISRHMERLERTSTIRVARRGR